jgi:hypothetical protein
VEPALVICCCLACVALGSVWGRQLLACELTLRARGEGRTPVCLRGRFYYVVPEPEYNRLASAAIRDRVNQNLGQDGGGTDWHGVGGW